MIRGISLFLYKNVIHFLKKKIKSIKSIYFKLLYIIFMLC